MSGFKAIISGGGTGGHIFPAISIANEIKRRRPDAEILFVGANGRMEMEKVPQAGYEIKGLNIAGFQRGAIWKNIGLPFKILSSLLTAHNIVKQFSPNVAVGVGGYASGPLLRAAGFAGVPTVIQEQNSFAGITNKLLAKNAKVICTAYDGMEKVFPKEKIVLTGNPVRAAVVEMKASRAEAIKYFGLEEGRKTILITGGSLGARTLNQGVEAGIEKLKTSGAQLIWQTGKTYFEQCRKAAEGISNIKVLQFVDRMDYAYACADVIISRAGASTISELQLVGKPVILVPSPNVTEDHQTYNAMALVRNNAAMMIKDDEAKVSLLATALDLLNDNEQCQLLSENIKKMGIPNAAERIVDEIFKVAKN
ncbi:MAG TPA: undecaprenyldiphospho-muramoylpentapeptide beta-N-acetylglucosaminyltransferase [Chitinophagales bacterium]|nr:undecaprenyldiphospho-muramoylpentapeptide beta-N-acetylglucosaminyltransferase [Chitinophagales bacterium]